MPEYKNIWFADNSEPMSVAEISETQAISIGDALENLKYNTSIICTDDAQVLEQFPQPKQGDRVYRADIGVEQMYFETYSPTLNPYGKNTPGWYAVSSGVVPIYPTNVSHDGTSPISVNSVGKVSFTSVTNVYLPEVFSDEFRNYKVVVNQTNSAAATQVQFRYISSGVEMSGSLYHRKVLTAETATVAPPPSAGQVGTVILIQNSSSFRNSYSETTFFGPRIGIHPRSLTNTIAGNFSTAARIEQSMSFYNSTSDIMDGIVLRTGAQRITGTIQVYGYR